MSDREWVRLIPKRPGGALFESCALAEPPGDGWLHADEHVVDLLHRMQGRLFTAEDALRNAMGRIHSACDEIARAQGDLA